MKTTVKKSFSALLALLLSAVVLALPSCNLIADTIKDELSELLPSELNGVFDGTTVTVNTSPDLTGEQTEETSEDTHVGDLTPTSPSVSSPDESTPSVSTPTPTPTPTPVPTPTPTPTPTPNTIPYRNVPDFPVYTMPEEQFPDQLEREASLVIDGAICRAIATVLVMRDGRHSNVSYPFEEDANGFCSELSLKQRGLLDDLVGYAENFESFIIKTSEYGDRLIEDVLTVAKPLSLLHPDLDSYFSFYPTGRLDAIGDLYFDPNRDENASVGDGETILAQVRHDAGLMMRIVKRIVSKMPEGLTTYDKYFYLSMVLCEQCTYDVEPDNKFTPYGALVSGRCVCEGYSRAFYLLCREANLWCAYRMGMPRGEGHVWNMVKLDSGIYNLDVTWCDARDPHSKSWYDFFIRPDEAFKTDGHAANDGVKGTGSFEANPYQAWN